MAKSTEKVNKGQLIRDYLKNNKDVTATEASAALTKMHGVEISRGYVENVRYTDKVKKNKNKTAKSIEVADLITAKEFIEKFGGMERAKQAIEVLSKLA
jgi:hypothetical protein